MVVVALEERVMLPLCPLPSLLLNPRAVAYLNRSEEADTLLLMAAMVVLALEETVMLPL